MCKIVENSKERLRATFHKQCCIDINEDEIKELFNEIGIKVKVEINQDSCCMVSLSFTKTNSYRIIVDKYDMKLILFKKNKKDNYIRVKNRNGYVEFKGNSCWHQAINYFRK